MFFSTFSYSTDRFGNLTKEDQPYYKNEAGDGMNKLERIDSAVIEINKLYKEIALLKAEVGQLKLEIIELKKNK